MANVKEILAVVRGALKDEPGTITVSAAKDGVDVLAWMEGVSGGDWEIHVAIPFGDDLTGPLSAAYGRADASGYYHPVPAPEVPGPVTARGGALCARIAGNGLALAAVGDREADLIDALRAVVLAHDLDDADELARAVARARELAAPYHPDIAEAPAPTPAPGR